MDPKKLKDGFSVREIEGFAKKHRVEVFFVLAFLLSLLFSFVFFTGWSSLLASIGGICGVLFPKQAEGALKKATAFFAKQEDTTQLILAIAGLVLAMFLPLLIFLLLGSAGGRYLLQLMEISPSKDEHK